MRKENELVPNNEVQAVRQAIGVEITLAPQPGFGELVVVPSNEVLAVLIWYLWDEGNLESVAAVGVVLMTVLFLLTLLLRVVGFGRDLTQSGSKAKQQ